MFKTGRWRTDKDKIKAFFKLHFHATGVAQVVGDSLVISLIPADVGKPTVRSEKAVIRDGTCYWENPMHESLRFFREPRTGKFQEKIYYFVISNGWTKNDFIGEVSIDFASYAESFKVSSVSLPLKNAKSKAVLHVSIQRVQEDVDQREILEIEGASIPSNDRSLRAQLTNSDANESIKSEYTCAPSSPLYDEIPVTPKTKQNNRRSCGSDQTISSSENSYGLNNPTELGFEDNVVVQDPSSILPTIDSLPESTSNLSTRGVLSTSSCLDTVHSGAATSAAPPDVAAIDEVLPEPEPVVSSCPTARGVHHACLDTSQLRAAMPSVPNDMAAANLVVPEYEPVASGLPITGVVSTSTCLDTTMSRSAMSPTLNELVPLDGKISKPQPVASDFPKTVHKEQLTSQIEFLPISGPEASTDNTVDSPPRDVLSVEKSKESSSLVIDELRAEISTLSQKAEVAELELQILRKQIVRESCKGQELIREVISLKDERNALRVECEKAKAKNKFEKGDPRALNEELRQEVNYEKEHNANLRVQLMKMQESNSELILAVRELDEMLEQKDNELLNLSNCSKSETENKQEESIADLYNELEMHRRDKEELEGHMEQLVLNHEILKQENQDLYYQLEQSQVQEQLKLQYECSSSYATINELQIKVDNLENELTKQSSKFSESLATIAELEEHAKGLTEDLEKQAQGFEDDIEMLIHDKVELEKRAITAEEALRKMQWQNANTAERIHDELQRLSVEMTSTLESNEKFTKKALFEANELRMQKSYVEDLLKKSKEELHLLTEIYETKLNELSSQLSSKVNHMEQLEIEKAHGEERNTTLSEEMLMLRAVIETLKAENNSLSAEAEEKQSLKSELEQVNVSMKEIELVLEKAKAQKNEREREIVHLREEAEKSVNELNSLRRAKDEKKIMIENLQLELETLQNQYDELKHLLSQDELEKDNLKKQIKLLESQMKLKEDALKTCSNSYLEKEKDLQNKIEELERRLTDSQISVTCLQKVDRDNDAIYLDGDTCEVSNITTEESNTVSYLSTENGESEFSSKNNVESCGISAREQEDIGESSKEMELLKERNKEMEYELKEMQERYSEMSLKLAEVEGARQQLMMRVRNLKNSKKNQQ